MNKLLKPISKIGSLIAAIAPDNYENRYISPNYFASLFKQAKGISPHKYVIQQRVERAKVMLSKTDLAMADNALRVGFSNQSHLTQQFERVTGLTPKQVR